MIGCLFHNKQEGVPLIMKNNISQMATTTTLTGPYPFHKIFHNQIAKWLPYVLDSLTNSIFQVLNRWWRRPYLSRGPKGRSHKVLNHKILVANCYHLFER